MWARGGYPGGWEWVFGLGLQTSRNKPQQINLYHHNPPGGRGIGAGTSIPYSVGEWIYVVGRFDEHNVDMLNFYPGEFKKASNIYDQATGYADAIVPQNTWSPLTIATIETQWQMYEGLIDELHISSVYRSDAWIKACYYSESDTLITYLVMPESTPSSPALTSSSSLGPPSASPASAVGLNPSSTLTASPSSGPPPQTTGSAISIGRDLILAMVVAAAVLVFIFALSMLWLRRHPRR